jgi:hypothetical protein
MLNSKNIVLRLPTFASLQSRYNLASLIANGFDVAPDTGSRKEGFQAQMIEAKESYCKESES